MGCDIHLTLERRLRKEKKHIVIPEKKDDDGNIIQKEIAWTESNKEWHWCDILERFDRHTWSDRVYGMFAVLANVRNYDHFNLKGTEPRGIPDDICLDTLRRYADKVISDEEYKEKEEKDFDSCAGYVSKTDAEEYVRKGYSRYIELQDKRLTYYNGTYCTDPDWHSASWCTVDELEKAFDTVFRDKDGNINFESDYIEWIALIGAMNGYEASGEYECRAVFWFDN